MSREAIPNRTGGGTEPEDAALGWDWTTEEIRRVAAKGCHAISFHSDTHRFGLPDHHGDEWDPAWQAMQSPGVTVPERGIVEVPVPAEPESHADEAPPSWRRVASVRTCIFG